LCLHAFEQPYRHQQTAITSMSATTWRLRKLFLDFTLQRWLVQRVLARARREDISSSASSASPSFHLCALPLTLQPPFYLPIFFSMKDRAPPHHEKPAQVLEICTSADYRHSLARVLALSFSLARALVLSLSFFLSLSSGGKRGGSGSLSFEHLPYSSSRIWEKNFSLTVGTLDSISITGKFCQAIYHFKLRVCAFLSHFRVT
jgi:hypothetical protein